jgi:hypothetical protein
MRAYLKKITKNNKRGFRSALLCFPRLDRRRGHGHVSHSSSPPSAKPKVLEREPEGKQNDGKRRENEKTKGNREAPATGLPRPPPPPEYVPSLTRHRHRHAGSLPMYISPRTHLTKTAQSRYAIMQNFFWPFSPSPSQFLRHTFQNMSHSGGGRTGRALAGLGRCWVAGAVGCCRAPT